MSTSIDIKEKLKNYYRRFHSIPSIREFCTLLGRKESYRTQAKRILDNLVESEFLVQNEKGKYLPGENFFAYPLFHGLKAGSFTKTSEVMDYINLEEYIVRKPNHTIIVTVSGDSMIEAGINDGDLVVVETVNNNFKEGDIIVAELEGEYTVKFYHKDSQGNPYLRPGNPNYDDIKFNDLNEVKFVGKVIRSIKNF